MTQRPTTKRSSDHPTQAERFAATARALGADEDEATFKAKLAVIARQKPDDGPPQVTRSQKMETAMEPQQMPPQRKFLVHAKDKNGDEWIVGTDLSETADAIADDWKAKGYIGVRIVDTQHSQ